LANLEEKYRYENLGEDERWELKDEISRIRRRLGR
jgi:hypothetical protein